MRSPIGSTARRRRCARAATGSCRAPPDSRVRAPFSEPAWGYAIAVVCALGAWALRMAIDRVLPGYVPFVTFFLAVAVAGWLGGFGPAVLAMTLSAFIARYFYLAPMHALHLHDLTTAAALGIFVFVCLVIGALTATLHSALRRIQVLSNRLEALGVAPEGEEACRPPRAGAGGWRRQRRAAHVRSPRLTAVHGPTPRVHIRCPRPALAERVPC